MKNSFTRHAAGMAALVFLCGQAQAQEQGIATLKEVTVTGNPLGATDPIAPATQYSGTRLLLRSQSTLGETRRSPISIATISTRTP